MLSVAKKIIEGGIKTAIITMARQGLHAVQGDEIIRVYAPRMVKVIDRFGRGRDVFIGIHLWSFGQGWGLEETIRLAIAGGFAR